MGNTILPFDELMKAVLEQLKSQKYMSATGSCTSGLFTGS